MFGLIEGIILFLPNALPQMYAKISTEEIKIAMLRIEEIKDVADFITKKQGGNGAVREICDLIIKINE